MVYVDAAFLEALKKALDYLTYLREFHSMKGEPGILQWPQLERRAVQSYIAYHL